MCHRQREERQELARPRRRPTLFHSDLLTPRNTISWTWSWSMAFYRWVAVGRQGETGPDRFANIIFQLTEALAYLHYSGHVIHRNVCPSSILITKRGIWKLAGMEYVGECFGSLNQNWNELAGAGNLYSYFGFTERMNENDLNSSIPCPPWSNRVSKMAQPNLDFMGE